jgi:hypothetical protein
MSGVSVDVERVRTLMSLLLNTAEQEGYTPVEFVAALHVLRSIVSDAATDAAMECGIPQ